MKSMRTSVCIVLLLISMSLIGLGLKYTYTQVKNNNSNAKASNYLSPYTPTNGISIGDEVFLIGTKNDSSMEFNQSTVWAGTTFSVPTDSSFPKGLSYSEQNNLSKLTLYYQLSSIPANGVVLNLKSIKADYMIPQIYVHSNQRLAGIFQIFGVEGDERNLAFFDIYRITIPKELLILGTNSLQLELRQTYTNNPYGMFVEWDYISMNEVTAPLATPINNKLTFMGVQGLSCTAFAPDSLTRDEFLEYYKWLGIAYSQNSFRFPWASNILHLSSQEQRIEAMEAISKMNFVGIGGDLAATIGDQQELDQHNGEISPSKKNQIDEYFATYGRYLNYWETANEPSNNFQQVGLRQIPNYVEAVAKYLKSTNAKPNHTKILGPGYWGYAGWFGSEISNINSPFYDPTSPYFNQPWEDSDQIRQNIDRHVDVVGYHHYNVELQDHFNDVITTEGGQLSNGLPRELIVTEFGTFGGAYDFPGTGTPISNMRGALADRQHRANTALASRSMWYSVITDEHKLGLIDTESGCNSKSTAIEAKAEGPLGEETDSMLQIYRRHALAYSTHGTPLSYQYIDNNVDQDIYVRAVDTSTLPPIEGSGGKSDKILINIVNFGKTDQTSQMKIKMPSAGIYYGQRIDDKPKLTDASKNIVLTTDEEGYITLTTETKALRGVQYILALNDIPYNPAFLQDIALQSNVLRLRGMIDLSPDRLFMENGDWIEIYDMSNNRVCQPNIIFVDQTPPQSARGLWECSLPQDSSSPLTIRRYNYLGEYRELRQNIQLPNQIGNPIGTTSSQTSSTSITSNTSNQPILNPAPLTSSSSTTSQQLVTSTSSAIIGNQQVPFQYTTVRTGGVNYFLILGLVLMTLSCVLLFPKNRLE